MNGRQECPSCNRHWTPPGPCGNWSGGEVCGYREPEPGPKLLPDKPRPPAKVAYAFTGRAVDPSPYLDECRRVLADVRARKGAA